MADSLNRVVDVAAIGAFYADWTKVGKGVTNYLSVPDLPLDTKGTKFAVPGGYIKGGDLAGYKPITSFNDAYFRDGVQESVKHAWYKGGKGALHPYKGETIPQYTDFQDNGKYSWVKSPTFYGDTVQVGRGAGAGPGRSGEPGLRHLNRVIGMAESIAKIKISPTRCTDYRPARARAGVAQHGREPAAAGQMLIDNIAKGDENLQQAGVPEG
jgi:hydrogenase large subunit